VLKYVAASFHLASVSTAHIKTVQHTKPYQQCEIPTGPDVVISKMPLPQSNTMAASVHKNSSLFCDASPCLPKYDNHNIKQSNFNSVCHSLLTISHSHTKCPTANTQQYIKYSTPLPADPLTLPHKMSNYQHTAVYFNSVCHSLLTPSHSHTKCPTTNTQQYIKFSTPLHADPLTLPHKMPNYQHTAVHKIQYATPS